MIQGLHYMECNNMPTIINYHGKKPYVKYIGKRCKCYTKEKQSEKENKRPCCGVVVYLSTNILR